MVMKSVIENQIKEVEQKLSFLDQKVGDINTTHQDREEDPEGAGGGRGRTRGRAQDARS
jgi:hypothetical protein